MTSLGQRAGMSLRNEAARAEAVGVEPPQELGGANVLKYAVVSPEVEAAGATRYWVGGEPFGPAAALAIARYRTEEGTYLFYLDEAGDAVTDTWHASLEDALHQAAFEYEGLSWVDVAEA